MGYSPGGRGVGQDLDSTTQQQFTHDNSPKTEVQELISTERPGIAHLQRRDGDSPSSEESHSITSEGSSLQTSELSCDAAGCPRHQGAAGPPQACPNPQPTISEGTHPQLKAGRGELFRSSGGNSPEPLCEEQCVQLPFSSYPVCFLF